MLKIIGKNTTIAVFDFCEKFNQLELTDSEKSILLPLVITSCGILNYFLFFDYFLLLYALEQEIKAKKTFQFLRELYLKALFHEIKANKRDIGFVKILAQVSSCFILLI